MTDERYRNDIKEIRALMENSTRFLSLSGWSGILAGVYALIGAYLIGFVINTSEFPGLINIALVGLGVMAISLLTGGILTYKKAKNAGQTLFSKTALRMIAHIGFPMLVGALFVASLTLSGPLELTPGVLLIFYGLGLINGSKYTLNDIRVLGIVNVALGVLALFFIQYGLYFWAAGFGLGHIVYGAYMAIKYEK